MAEKTDVALKTATNGEAISQHRLVRYNSSGLWVYCDAGEYPIGPARNLVAITTPLAVELIRNKEGTIKCVASEAMATAYVDVYTAADGKIGLTNTGVRVGKLISTGSGDGAVVEVLPDLARVPMVNTAADSNRGASSTSEVDCGKTFTIPADELKAGSVIKVRACGLVVNANTTPNLDVKLYAGTEVIATVTVAAAAQNDQLFLEADIVIRTIGASGTLIALVNAVLDASGTATAVSNKAQATEDTTSGLTIKMSVQFDASHADNTFRQDVLEVQHLR